MVSFFPWIPLSPSSCACVAVSSFHNNWQFTNVLSLLILLLGSAFISGLDSDSTNVAVSRRELGADRRETLW